MIYTVPVNTLDIKEGVNYLIYAVGNYFVGRFISRDGLLVVPHPHFSHTYLSTSSIQALAEIHNFQK
jgi:hypothetical protein